MFNLKVYIILKHDTVQKQIAGFPADEKIKKRSAEKADWRWLRFGMKGRKQDRVTQRISL